MAVTDTAWADWSATAASNAPDGAATPEIDDELRNIKAVCKSNLFALADTATYTGALTFNTGTLKVQSTTAGYLHNTTAGVVVYGYSIAAADLPTAIDAAKIADGSVSNTEFQYLNGVSTAIQTQINNITEGKTAQVVNTSTGAVATGTTVIPADDTIPQNTEGDEYMTLAITPASATNKLKIEVVACFGYAAAAPCTVALFQDTTANALASHIATPVEGGLVSVKFIHYMTAGTTSATTFKVRIGGQGGTLTFNGIASGRLDGGVISSSITITEIIA